MSRVVMPLAYRARIFSSKPVEPALMLGDQLRLEGAVAIAGRLERELAHIAADGLLRMSVAAVLRRWPGPRRLLESVGDGRRLRVGSASEVDVHLGVEHALEGGLHQGPHQAVEVVEGAEPGWPTRGRAAPLGLEDRIHAGISVKDRGWGI